MRGKAASGLATKPVIGLLRAFNLPLLSAHIDMVGEENEIAPSECAVTKVFGRIFPNDDRDLAGSRHLNYLFSLQKTRSGCYAPEIETQGIGYDENGRLSFFFDLYDDEEPGPREIRLSLGELNKQALQLNGELEAELGSPSRRLLENQLRAMLLLTTYASLDKWQPSDPPLKCNFPTDADPLFRMTATYEHMPGSRPTVAMKIDAISLECTVFEDAVEINAETVLHALFTATYTAAKSLQLALERLSKECTSAKLSWSISWSLQDDADTVSGDAFELPRGYLDKCRAEVKTIKEIQLLPFPEED